MNEYDLLIIGSGPAGYTAAFEAAARSMRVAMIERDFERIGGVCLSEGCIPLKGLIFHAHGTKDYVAVRDRVMQRVSLIRSGLVSRLKGSGVDLIEAEGAFISEREVEAGGRRYGGKFILIAAGSRPKRFFEHPQVYSSDAIFSLSRAPGRVLIIGGGVVGCEYATFLSMIGARVDIVEVCDSLLAGEDQEAVRVMIREFKKKGIGIFTNTRVTEIRGSGIAVLCGPEKQETREYDVIFETAGRVPATEGLNCSAAGVMVTDKGFIEVDNSYRTSVPHIYAAGDCIDTPMLAYTAAREAEAAVHHIATGGILPVDYRSMPRVVFSIPQVGGVGCTETEVGDRGIEPKVYRRYFRALGKAVVEGRDAGFVKIVTDAKTGAIIGASAVGEEIADMMNHIALMVGCGITVRQARASFYVHPSYSEIILDALQYGG